MTRNTRPTHAVTHAVMRAVTHVVTHVVMVGAALALAAAPVRAQAEDGAATPTDLAALADSMASSLVVVEYTVRPDKGELPAVDWAARANWMSDPAAAASVIDWDQQIKEERPAERAGYVIGADRVVTSDLMVHPRFIERIAVRAGDEVVDATPEAYARDQRAVFFKLERPLRGRTPLAFDGTRKGPYRSVAYRLQEGQWTLAVGGGAGRVTIATDGRRLAHAPGEVLITDRQGTPVGLTFSGELPLDGSWKGPPDAWETVTAARMRTLLADLQEATGRALPRVELRFRSPRGAAAGPYGFSRGPADAQLTEWHGTGILVDDRTIIVLASFKPKITARLEAIRVTGPDGRAVEASFAGTLRNYGCFLAELDEPMSGAVRLATASIADARNQLLLKVQIGVLGESRTAYCWRERFSMLSMGWRRQIYPVVPPSNPSFSGGAAPINFLFALDGSLVAAPIGHREKVAVEDGFGGYNPFAGGGAGMLAAEYIAGVVGADRGEHVDPENRPLSEAEENRLAWLGVEMQPMNPDLARVNDVVDHTGGGMTGAIVTYIYPGSPAADAGLEPGDILLRLHVEGQPKPIEVQMEGLGMYDGMFDQMWQRLDEIPAEYFDQMPKPWGSAENALTRALTDIGFGTPFTADVFRGGEVVSRQFVVTEGPAHYESATRFESASSGLTVRDLTYEVRRYFQVRSDGPGVIVSKVEPGSRAAVSGIYPLEMIVAVDDRPVHGVGELEAMLAAGGEFRLNIKRMTVGRIVKLTVDPAGE